jgi:GT2 family glycosyltransferase
MPESDLISVIIPNFNGRDFLDPCLRSVQNQRSAGFRVEILLIDNASTDGSADLAAGFPDVRFIRNHENIGYTKAVNQGLELAQGDWILLLNNDTMMQPGSLEQLWMYLKSGPATLGGVQPLLVYAGDPTLIDSTGIALSRRLRARDDLHGQPLSRAAAEPTDIWGCCAACALFKREVYTRCGMLDPDFFAEWDDVDFALRARWHGYRFALVPQAVVWHHRSPTSKRAPLAKQMRHHRNQLLTIRKAVPFPLWLRTIGYRMLRDLFMIPHYLRRQELGAMWAAWQDYRSLIPVMRARRRELLRQATVSNRQMTTELFDYMGKGEIQ